MLVAALAILCGRLKWVRLFMATPLSLRSEVRRSDDYIRLSSVQPGAHIFARSLDLRNCEGVGTRLHR